MDLLSAIQKRGLFGWDDGLRSDFNSRKDIFKYNVVYRIIW